MTEREDRQRDLEARGGASRAVYPLRGTSARVRERRVNQVAEAIWRADPNINGWPINWRWEEMPDAKRHRYLRMAEAAIEALR